HIFASYPASINKYSNNLKIGGYKIFLDGSPQGRTAWMLEPYKKGDENGEYFGYGTMKDQQVIEAIEISAKNNMQILAHCNGDRACQQFIHCVTKSEENLPIIKTLRPVAIHSQLMNETQLESCKDFGIIPSFFVAHVYYWGDTHIKNFGIKRAEKISMTRTALEKNIPFTLHQDAPVIEPNMLQTVWIAATRTTKNGEILGSDEKISVKDGLKAITINAAYQYFEEKEKGSIKVGKKANFVILSENPLTADINNLPNIKVLMTIKDGETIFKLN
ncbi:MAG: amidohydrolase family protein, partial [Oscillospiraceae bacterium]